MRTEPIISRGEARQRIDKWLWFARLVKSRTLGQKLAVSGRVRVNREKCDSASYALKVGDVLTIAHERGVRIVRVLDPGTRRGPAPEAQGLYEDLSPPPEPRQQTAVRDRGTGRPTKRDQRLLIGLKQRSGDDFPSGDD